ncbi:5-formyltetrahydrofolate cyclo-ligase [Paludisphaera soli]|uniref:5-formyltetrahydrofolate cyclo-ligase n=1 Tax=Paludisphaera soli TaxID=2712865 RepID=UPI0013EAA3C0|nr:5-formyltetrahydrofolate cyclo-ligase [Paludisphaera soli]
MPTTPAKKLLRIETIASILSLDPASRREQEAQMIARLRDLPGYRAAGTVLLYTRAFPEEIDTTPLLEDALAMGKRVACPRVDRRAGLVLHEIRDLASDLRPGMLDIPEPHWDAPIVDPRAIDWALAPGVAFDASGNRVGRGAGHYDRLLPKLREDVEVWALAFDRQIRDDLPVEPHDVPLRGVITATRRLERLGPGRDGQSTSPQEAAGGSA